MSTTNHLSESTEQEPIARVMGKEDPDRRAARRSATPQPPSITDATTCEVCSDSVAATGSRLDSVAGVYRALCKKHFDDGQPHILFAALRGDTSK